MRHSTTCPIITPGSPETCTRRRALTFTLLVAALASIGSWPGTTLAQVVPMEKWVGASEIVTTGEPIALHLRVGHERPVIFPEPVSLLDRAPLPRTGLTVDVDMALFAPGGAFEAETVVFVGNTTERRYRFEVSASNYGSRVPLRLVLP